MGVIGFIVYVTGGQRYLHVLTHSFPTRRSSDLWCHRAPPPGRRRGCRAWVPDDACSATTPSRSCASPGLPSRRAAGGGWRAARRRPRAYRRSDEHTSELQSLMRISYAVFCLKKKTAKPTTTHRTLHTLAT